MALRDGLSVVRKVGLFAMAIGISTVLGIVSIPTLITSIGAHAWASISLCQTVCQLVGIIVAFGWGVTGPSAVASTPLDRRPALYLESVVSRGYLFIGGLAVAIVVLFFLTRGEIGIAVLGSLAYLIPLLGASWYFTGEGRPARLFLCDSLPSLVGMLVGIVAAVVTRSPLAFLVAQVAGNVVALGLDTWIVLRELPREHAVDARPGTVVRSLRGQRHAVTSAVLSGLYVSAPVVAVQMFVPQSLPVYVMANSFFRYAGLAFSPIQQYIQGWIPGGDREGQSRRMRIAVWAAVVFGIVGGLAVALLSPVFSVVFSRGVIHVPFALSGPLGLAFCGVALSAIVGYACLTVLGRSAVLATSSLLGAIIGVPLIVGFAVARVLPGIAWGVAATELAVALYQLGAFLRAMRVSERESAEG